MIRRRAIDKHRAGYTLIELIAVIVIISTISSVVGSLVHESVKAYASASDQREAVERQSFALERIVRALREAAPLIGSSGTPGLTTAAADQCVFEDGTACELDGTDLMLTMPGSAAGPLARDVTAFELTYVGEDGTPLNFVGGDTLDMTRTIWIRIESEGVDTRTAVYLRATMGAL
jgi:prepilin-type N-terminal cleavage/methylation domain-containing protein